MKKFFLLLFSLVAFASNAQSLSEGFYRVQNYKTDRVLFVEDDKASVVVQAGTADLGAITPWLPSARSPLSDPQSVIYVYPKGDGYDLIAQGMSTYERIQMPIKISQYGSTNTYRCSASKGGMTLYLCDQTTSASKSYGKLGTKIPDDNVEYSRWYANSISENSDNYFGVKPTIEVGGKYYVSFYAGFSFKVASSGVKAYIVSEIGNGEVSVTDVTDKEIPTGTPILFECSSNNPSDNRLKLLGVGGSPLSSKLTGVYFCNEPDADDEYPHKNVTVFNSSTMRILGKSSSGKLAFVKDSNTLVAGEVEGKVVYCVPANTAVLKASSDKLSDEMIVSFSSTGIDNVAADNSSVQVVYSMLGVKIGEYGNDVNLSEILPKGIYVVNNKKYIVK